MVRSLHDQRLRWAEGTLQVLLRENPLFKRGLSLPQRIQYFTTMVSYFDASRVFVLSAIVSLSTRLAPIRTPWWELLAVVGTPLAGIFRSTILDRVFELYPTAEAALA